LGYLVSRGSEGNVSYSGTQYVNPTAGTRRLCIRTGSGEDGVIRYGLTTDPAASEYCGMRMRINGNTAYIGRSEPAVQSSSYTTSSLSSYGSLSTRSASAARTYASQTSSGTFTMPIATISRGTSSTVSGNVTKNISYVVQTRITGYNSYRRQNAAGKCYSYSTSRSVYHTSSYQTHTEISQAEGEAGHNFNI
jgi:hypothetical protein